jgi:hypothetical protein
MITVHFIILVLAFVLVLLYAMGARTPKIDLGWLGFALFILDFLLVNIK